MRPATLVLVLLIPATAAAEDFPRRLLVVHSGNPLYLNPLTSRLADGPDRVRASAERLAELLRVPTGKGNHQLVVLADTDEPPLGRSLTKAAILGTVRSFCATSRSQDRVLVLFAGHAFEKDGKAYFAPVEADPTDASTLVPVADLLAALGDCKATQKVVVWDVARRNPTRAPIRPDGGAMTASLAKALTAAPAGVEVVLACSTGESALEYAEPRGDARLFAGSALQDALRQAFADRASAKTPAPNDAIDIAAAFPDVVKYVASAASAYKVNQKPLLAGRPGKLAAFNAREAPAAAVALPEPLSPAAAREAKTILEELALPALAFGTEAAAPPLALFTPEALKPYVTDIDTETVMKNPERYSLRVAVLRALKSIRECTPGADPKSPRPIVAVAAPLTERAKKAVLDAQGPVALALVSLETELDALTALADLRGKETRRWQTHYDFTVAQLRLRLAMLNEYNLVLGHVRTETLPELAKGMTGWRLGPAEKMQSRKPTRDLAEEGLDGLKGLAAAHKGTPWEVLARRALLTPPGLKWEPIGPGN